MVNKLEEARKIINEVDLKMAELFVQRMKAVEMVYEHKKEFDLPILDPKREEAVIERNSMLIEDELLKEYYIDYLKHLMSISRKYQCQMKNRKTPIMGWASWNAFRTDISEDRMKAQADALISTGLSKYGYEYFNMDDGFFGGRGEDGILKFHKNRFPNGIKVVADYAHSLGLKAGIYSEGGKNTCAYYWDNEGDNGVDVGLYGYEEQDLKMFLEEYGFDFIKVDWCGGQKLGLDEEQQYTKIAKIIDEIRERTGRCIVFNICRWQFPGEWATKIADSWRTGADIRPTFESLVYQIDNIRSLARYTSPGHVNDLDMMQVGNGLNHEEEKSHFAMWCMMSTPLMIGCDLTMIPESTLEILKNEELIAINQDPAFLQAYVAKEIKNDDGVVVGEVWIKNLGCEQSCEKAVAFFNRSEESVNFKVSLADVGLDGEVISVRDLWEHSDISSGEMMEVTVEKHCTKVYRVKASKCIPIQNQDDLDDRILEEIKTISYENMDQLLASGGKLIDVRSQDEYNRSHLKGAINLPYDNINSAMRKENPDKGEKLIVYCSAGKRSMQARNLMVYMGYQNVYILKGHEGLLQTGI